MINLREHKAWGYAPRTEHNASQGVNLAISESKPTLRLYT